MTKPMKARLVCLQISALALALSGPLVMSAFANQTQVADVLIKNGLVFTGEDRPGIWADVAFTEDRVIFVGDAEAEGVEARRTIDATGMVVSPGLIDVHTHSETELRSQDAVDRRVPNHTLQGVSTIFVGNDGGGTPDISEMAAGLRAAPAAVNVAQFVGFGEVRKRVIGETARAASADELAEMRNMVGGAMCEGALGLSAGLYYAPQSYATTSEVIALAEEAGWRGGIYDTHLRDESSDNIGLIAAVNEAIEIGLRASIPVHIAHIKAQGVDVHGKSSEVIGIINAARARGQNVTADQYPWIASGTRVSNALVPRWAMDGGMAEVVRRLGDASLRDRLEREIADNIRRRGGPESILLTSGPHRGITLAALAQQWGVSTVEAGVRVVRDEGDARIASFNMTTSDMENFARQEWVISSSDASTGHPRKFGSMPLRWRALVREREVLTAQQFIHRSTGLTADIYGLTDRGYLRRGTYADVLVFDPRGFRENADFANPTLLSEGVQFLFVNGTPVVEAGNPTSALPGHALLKPRNAGWHCPS